MDAITPRFLPRYLVIWLLYQKALPSLERIPGLEPSTFSVDPSPYSREELEAWLKSADTCVNSRHHPRLTSSESRTSPQIDGMNDRDQVNARNATVTDSKAKGLTAC